MNDAIIVSFCHQRSHRHHVFWIVVADGLQIPEFSFSCGRVDDDIRRLQIYSATDFGGANEIDFASPKLTHGDLVTHTEQVLKHHILNNLFNVALA